MIWILDNNPAICARYQSDQDILGVLNRVIRSLYFDPNSEIGDWAKKRSQNWMWLYKFADTMDKEIVCRKLGEDYPGGFYLGYEATLSILWDHMPVLPCSPRGKKSKFPPHDKFPRTRHRGIPTKRTIHSYRKLFNETKPGAVWFKGTYQPPWYYGDV